MDLLATKLYRTDVAGSGHEVHGVNQTVILAPVGELMYYYSLPKCIAECTKLHIKH